MVIVLHNILVSFQVDILHPLAQLSVNKCCRPPVRTGDLYDYYRTAYLNKNGHHVIIANEFELYDYDVACDTWSALCDHEIPVSKFGLAVHQSLLHLVGGKIVTTESPTKQEDSDKIWYLDDKLGWRESSMSPMPSKVSGAVAVAKDGLFIVVGESATPAYNSAGSPLRRTISLDVYQDGKWLSTRCYEDIVTFVFNTQLATYDDRLYFSETIHQLRGNTYEYKKCFHSVGISDVSESRRSDLDFSTVDYLEPSYGMSNKWISNLISFGSFLVAIALSKNETSLAMYTYQDNHHWRMELSIYQPTNYTCYPTNPYPIRVVALSRQIMVITYEQTFMISFKGKALSSSRYDNGSMIIVTLQHSPTVYLMNFHTGH